MSLHELRTSAFIAWRYFFSKKSTNAVNVIAIVAVIGIALVVTSMICVLSVFNGFESFTVSQLSSLSPKYIISAPNNEVFDIGEWEVSATSEVLTTQAVASFEENSKGVTVIGVDSLYHTMVPIEQYMFDGSFDLGGAEAPTAVIGVGVGSELNAGVGYWSPLKLTVPNRIGRVSTIFPAKGFLSEEFHITGVFRVDQPEDKEVVYVDISVLRALLQYDNTEVSYLAIGEEVDKGGANEVAAMLGEGFVVADRFEQHPEIFRVLRMEKWVSFLLLLFVLLLSLFSVISTLGMLIIEKRADSQTLRFLGARPKLVDNIIIIEGWLLSITGLVIGLVLGCSLVLLQGELGFLKLGGASSGGAFLINAYPVDLRAMDVLGISLVILLVGWVSSIIAYKLFQWNASE